MGVAGEALEVARRISFCVEARSRAALSEAFSDASLSIVCLAWASWASRSLTWRSLRSRKARCLFHACQRCLPSHLLLRIDFLRLWGGLTLLCSVPSFWLVRAVDSHHRSHYPSSHPRPPVLPFPHTHSQLYFRFHLDFHSHFSRRSTPLAPFSPESEEMHCSQNAHCDQRN